MSHALRIEDVTAIEPDPHLAFAHKVDAVLTSGESLAIIAIEIKGAAALYVGKCVARALRELGTQVPRFAERDNALAPPLRAFVAPANATTEFAPITPDSDTPCPNDDASTADSSTTSNPTAADAAHDASQQPQRPGSDDPEAANAATTANTSETSPSSSPKAGAGSLASSAARRSGRIRKSPSSTSNPSAMGAQTGSLTSGQHTPDATPHGTSGDEPA